jgi:tRNA (mo5U34)-methyltransferase
VTRLLEHIVSASSPERYAEISALGPWFYNLHLPDGSQTAPGHALGDFPAFKWSEIMDSIPSDLSGWNVLDVGCNAGFYSFEMAKRGATVTGIDIEPLFLRQAEWASREFGLEDRVRWKQMHVYDLAHDQESYDLVLFLGVFYHLRYPLLGLDVVARKVRRMLVFQTLTMPGEEVENTVDDYDIMDRDSFARPGWPKIAFIEHSFAGDQTNWWAPNHAAVEAMLRSAGMEITSRPAHEFYVCRPGAGLQESSFSARAAEELRAATRAVL